MGYLHAHISRGMIIRRVMKRVHYSATFVDWRPFGSLLMRYGSVQTAFLVELGELSIAEGGTRWVGAEQETTRERPRVLAL